MAAAPQDFDADFGLAGPRAGTLGSLGDERPLTCANFIFRSKYPAAAFFHLLFKISAFVLYICSEWFSLEYTTTFVIVVLLLSADFWTVKNVSGRLLVGLRWWNKVNPDTGETEWIYESAPPGHTVSALDSRIFWGALYAAPLVWGACGVGAFITFSWDWLLVHAVASALTGANLLGYTRCSGEARRRVQASIDAAGALQGALRMPGVQNALPMLGASMVTFLGSALVAGSGAGSASAGGNGGALGAEGGIGGASASAPGGMKGGSSSGVVGTAGRMGNGGGGGMTRAAQSDYDTVSDPFARSDAVSI